MSTTAERVPQALARRLAEGLAGRLAPGCERIEIAGSLRRGAPDVGDIELVCVPRVEERRGGLFGDQIAVLDHFEERCAGGIRHGWLQPRCDKHGVTRWGPRYKAAIWEGMAADICAVRPPAQWGVIFLIRTGPAAFGHRLVTPRRQGGWLPDYLRVKDGALWHEDGSVLVTPTEEAVFELIGRAYIRPEQRL